MKVQLIGLTLQAALLSSTLAFGQQTSSSPTSGERPLIEPKAVDVLKSACASLEGAKAMSFTAVNTYEKAARNGQPLYYSVLNHVTMQRPDKLRVITPGDGVPDEFYYDGKSMMVYVPSADMVEFVRDPVTRGDYPKLIGALHRNVVEHR